MPDVFRSDLVVAVAAVDTREMRELDKDRVVVVAAVEGSPVDEMGNQSTEPAGHDAVVAVSAMHRRGVHGDGTHGVVTAVGQDDEIVGAGQEGGAAATAQRDVDGGVGDCDQIVAA